jgi:hypothetical protein
VEATVQLNPLFFFLGWILLRRLIDDLRITMVASKAQRPLAAADNRLHVFYCRGV